MTCQPFKPPPLSKEHGRHLAEFLSKTTEEQLSNGEKIFEVVIKNERIRYFDSVNDHCCYCGRKEPTLDIDHFLPKKHAKHHEISEDRLDFYKWLAGVSDSINYEKMDFDECLSGGHEKHYANYAITPKNLVPSCIYCNRRARVRMADETVAIKGKGSIFPILPGGEAALFHPGDMSWRQLIENFTFRDLTSNFGSKEPQQQNLCLTLIMPSVTVLTATDTATALRAATVIDLFGLNRLALCQERHRQRLILRAYLNGLSVLPVASPPSNVRSLSGHVINLLSSNPQLTRASVTVADIVSGGPHRLAMLDELRTWLGEKRFTTLDLDRFMCADMR